jgi:putative membrane protein
VVLVPQPRAGEWINAANGSSPSHPALLQFGNLATRSANNRSDGKRRSCPRFRWRWRRRRASMPIWSAPQRRQPVTSSSFDPRAITRPDPRLQTYYLLFALVSGPFYPFAVLPLLFKYHTLRYRFDDAGMAMSWGVLFRREIYLTYRRIQDIHVTRNLLQRWLGLATVSIQTASGSATPEMMIEGILEAEGLRDFLYRQMRGARAERTAAPLAEGTAGPTEREAAPAEADEALALLHDIRDALQACARGRSGQS